MQMIEIFSAIQRAVLQTGVLLLIGAAAWKLWIAPRAFSRSMNVGASTDWRSVETELNRRIARIAGIVAMILIPIWLLRGYLQVAAFRDPFAPLSEDILILMRYTIFGPVWVVQGIGIVLIAIVLNRLGRPARANVGSARDQPQSGSRTIEWGLVVFAAALLASTLALSSHGLSAEGNRAIAVSADLIHTVAAGAWLGSLVLILAACRIPGVETDVHFGAQLKAFSPIAIGAVTTLIAMGTYLGWQYLGTFSNLLGTPYGRILMAKVAVAGVVMLMGLLNWRKGMPAIDTAEARETVWRRARWEVMVAAVVLLLTGVLTGAPRPPAPADAGESSDGDSAGDVRRIPERSGPAALAGARGDPNTHAAAAEAPGFAGLRAS